jgi:hypothetical protein
MEEAESLHQRSPKLYTLPPFKMFLELPAPSNRINPNKRTGHKVQIINNTIFLTSAGKKCAAYSLESVQVLSNT